MRLGLATIVPAADHQAGELAEPQLFGKGRGSRARSSVPLEGPEQVSPKTGQGDPHPESGNPCELCHVSQMTGGEHTLGPAMRERPPPKVVAGQHAAVALEDVRIWLRRVQFRELVLEGGVVRLAMPVKEYRFRDEVPA